MRRGRLLEQLVQTLESMFAREGVRVSSPDYKIGVISGERREMDVTVRGRIGSADVFLLFECRTRKKTDGLDWIEQLAAKRMDVGADRAIAVSTSGFSKRAVEAARRLGVELRRIDEVDANGVFPSHTSLNAMFWIQQSRVLAIIAHCIDENANDLVEEKLCLDDKRNDRRLVWEHDSTPVPLERLLGTVLDDEDSVMWQDLPEDSAWVRRDAEIAVRPAGCMIFRRGPSTSRVRSLEYQLELRLHLVDAEKGAIQVYRDAEGTPIAGAQTFGADVDDILLRYDLTWTPQGEQHYGRFSRRRKTT